MSDSVKFTPQQLAAIENRGGALLVSAAAGSGKTKVLVERLLKYVTDEGADIDSFLIITYTNAAAGELRAKIIDALSERLAKDPGNIALHRQFERCYRTKISTIHSFCTDIIRQNAHIIGITPDFKVIDETESALLRERVMEDLLEERYEHIENGDNFSRLCDMFSSGRNDSRLIEHIYTVYENMLMDKNPENWAERQKEMLRSCAECDAADTVWGKSLIENARASLEFWLTKMRGLYNEAQCDEKLGIKYGPSVSVTISCIENFIASLDKKWDDIRDSSVIEFPRAGGVAGYDDFKNARRLCQKETAKITKVFSQRSDELMGDMEEIAPILGELIDLASDFRRRYAELKLRRGVVDFSDEEHLALRVLLNEDGTRSPRAIAISENYTEIMVDEYQDVNEVQEAIFNAVSRDGKNIFMVGDVKQSIYRFRRADPSIFIEKSKTMPKAEDAAGGQPRKIVLTTNFRSRAGVLAAVNYIFETIMSPRLGEVDYTEDERLNPGLEFPETDEPQMEIVIANGGDLELPDEFSGKTELEAELVADKILDIWKNGKVADGNGGMRHAEFGDIAILLRSVKAKAAAYAAALQKRGIPVLTDSSEDFFKSAEVMTVISFLAAIDNPRQDIPLISAMSGFLGGFTPDELAQIRVCDKNGDFYDALVISAETNDKSRAFLETLQSFRDMAPGSACDEILWELYCKLNAMAIVGAMEGGERRRNNLTALFELARGYESEGYRGLFGFVTYLREIADSGAVFVKTADTSDESCVKIVSIHKSKGLEYPIVILADTTKRFNKTDANAPLPIHKELGMGPEITDLVRKIKYPSIARMAVSHQMVRETLSEEMRVLYVALTRARERLIVFASYTDAEKQLQKLGADLSRPLPPEILEGASSIGDWIVMTALMRTEAAEITGKPPFNAAFDDGFSWNIHFAKQADGERIELLDQRQEEKSEETAESIAKRFEYRYPFESGMGLPSKITATELKGHFADIESNEDAAPMLKPKKTVRRPEFTGAADKLLTAAERGTALHMAMQFIDYNKCTDARGIKSELDRLEKMRIITEKQAKAVSVSKILRLFTSETGKMILSAENIRREFKFSLLADAKEFAGGCTDDKILLQGVCDCILENGSERIIIDYKTDRVTADTVNERAEYYRGQIEAYKRAVCEIFGKGDVRAGLYFFAVGEMIWI